MEVTCELRTDDKSSSFWFIGKKLYMDNQTEYKHKRSAKAAAIRLAKRHNFEIVNWEDR